MVEEIFSAQLTAVKCLRFSLSGRSNAKGLGNTRGRVQNFTQASKWRRLGPKIEIWVGGRHGLELGNPFLEARGTGFVIMGRLGGYGND